MDKKMYEELELEVVRFDAEDVIATSGEGGKLPPIDCQCLTERYL